MKKASKSEKSVVQGGEASAQPPKETAINVTGCQFMVDGKEKFATFVELARAMGEQSKAYGELARAMATPLHSGHMLMIDGGERK